MLNRSSTRDCSRDSRFQRLLSAVLVAAMLAACRLLTPSGSNSPSISPDTSIPASQIQVPKGASAADLDQAEGQVWQALRAPIQAELGSETEDLFSQADSLRTLMLTQAAQDLKLYGQSFKGRGLAQFETLASVIVFLSELVPQFASHDEGMASKEQPFDEDMEIEMYELWHHEGRRARFGAAMMAPDYAWWHGFYELKKRSMKLQEMADELIQSGKPAPLHTIRGAGGDTNPPPGVLKPQ